MVPERCLDEPVKAWDADLHRWSLMLSLPRNKWLIGPGPYYHSTVDPEASPLPSGGNGRGIRNPLFMIWSFLWYKLSLLSKLATSHDGCLPLGSINSVCISMLQERVSASQSTACGQIGAFVVHYLRSSFPVSSIVSQIHNFLPAARDLRIRSNNIDP